MILITRPPFASLKHTDPDLAQKVAVALLSMKPGDEAALKGEYAGWTVPLDYSSVHDLFRELKIGPYKGLDELSFKEAIKRYQALYKVRFTSRWPPIMAAADW